MSPKTEKAGLEGLPEPLIEKLCLDTLEPNLAGTSRYINKVLSKEGIYKVFILFAFFENDERLPVDDSHFKPATYQFLTSAERLHLQEVILEQPWCTLRRIKQFINILVYLALATERKSDQKKRQVGTLPAANDVKGLKSLYQRRYPRHAPHRHQGTYSPCTMILPRGLDRARDAIQFHYVPRRALNPKSWDNEAFQYLLFIQLHLTPCPVFDIDAVFEGVEKAIKQQSIQPLYLLLNMIYTPRFDQSRPDQAQLALPTRFFHLACQQGDDSVWILDLLIAANRLSIPTDDPVLNQWARQPTSESSNVSAPRAALARWMLRHLAGWGNRWPESPLIGSFKSKLREVGFEDFECPCDGPLYIMILFHDD
jgi:hypothetical protein